MTGWTVECANGHRGAPLFDDQAVAEDWAARLDDLVECGPHRVVEAAWQPPPPPLNTGRGRA